ncbi:MAG: ubiquinone/menaquinone biosynthesis methyltransferase [Candidatus Magnetomorum sp.]|nr:ubiquinone/menaquinone biosynthesis methyltransferase [Candidatus Magnetomorum sp.]
MDKHELPYIQDMFESIAFRYDLLNRTLSLRQDITWRNKLVQTLNISQHAKILDVASGTGDVAMSIRNQFALTTIHCIDFSFNMLSLAQKKIKSPSNDLHIYTSCADAFDLPYPKMYFDAVTMAFGIRNVVKKERLLHSLFHHVKPGGQILILELTLPEMIVLKKMYLLYFKKLLPAIGQLVSKSNFAYTYLPESVISFPSSPAFSQMMRRSGFENVQWLPMTAGICTLFVGQRPLCL